jgi:hypothetical protein
MTPHDTWLATRAGAWAAIGGSTLAFTGAAMGVASGTDIDGALARGDMAGYLRQKTTRVFRRPR